MADKKMVFNKVKDLHYKAGIKNPSVSIDDVATQLQLTTEEVNEHIAMLKTLRLIRFAESTPGSIEVTKIGLSTKVGN
jgi:predicted ArsR family transcriptional regulator